MRDYILECDAATGTTYVAGKDGRLYPDAQVAAADRFGHLVSLWESQARAYAEAPSAVRLTEIAEGLALWASEHQTLPGGPMLAFEGTTPTLHELRTRRRSLGPFFRWLRAQYRFGLEAQSEDWASERVTEYLREIS